MNNSSLYREGTLYFWPSQIHFPFQLSVFEMGWIMQNLECRSGSTGRAKQTFSNVVDKWKLLGEQGLHKYIGCSANQLLLFVILCSIYVAQGLPEPGIVSKSSITLTGFLCKELSNIHLNYGHQQHPFAFNTIKRFLFSVSVLIISNMVFAILSDPKSIKLLFSQLTVTPRFVISAAVVQGCQFSLWYSPERLHFLWDWGKSQIPRQHAREFCLFWSISPSSIQT